MSAVGTRRDTKLSLALMAVNRAVIRDLEAGPGSDWYVVPYFLDGTTGAVVSYYGVDFSIVGVNSGSDVIAAAEAAVNAYATAQGYTLTNGIIWYLGATNPARVVNTPTRALSTAYQASATQDSLVFMSVEIDAALSLSGGAKGTCTLEVSPTSGFSTVVNDSETINGNTGTLTIGLNTVGAGGGAMVAFVPAGYYYKAVTANTTGTPTFTVLGTTEVVGI